jgi:CRP/FNR family transcriptional regulator, cyclic AMP receptor protein
MAGSWSRTWDGVASPELTEALASAATLRKLVDRELLYQRGEAGNELYGVRSGYLRLSVINDEGMEGLIGHYGPGTWFGEVSIFDERPRPTDAYAVGPTEVLVVQAAALRQILDCNPLWYRDFARVLCNKLRLALTHIEINVMPMSVRIGLRLLDLAQVYGQSEQGGIGLALPQDDLARMLGVSRQSINKELRMLEEQGWLWLRRGKLILRNMPALRQHVADGGAADLLDL